MNNTYNRGFINDLNTQNISAGIITGTLGIVGAPIIVIEAAAAGGFSHIENNLMVLRRAVLWCLIWADNGILLPHADCRSPLYYRCRIFSHGDSAFYILGAGRRFYNYRHYNYAVWYFRYI